MGAEKRENGGQKVGQRLWRRFDGFGYKGDVGLGRCRGILVWRVGRMMGLWGMQRAGVMYGGATGPRRKVMAGGSKKTLGLGVQRGRERRGV